MDPDLRRELCAWGGILTGAINMIIHRAAEGGTPPRLFYDDIATSLESLAKRVRRNIKEG